MYEVTASECIEEEYRDRILGRNRDKSLMSFPPCYLQSLLLTDFTLFLLPPFDKSGLMVCNVNIVITSLKSENSQDYARKPQGNCTFMNSVSGQVAFVLPFVTSGWLVYGDSPLDLSAQSNLHTPVTQET